MESKSNNTLKKKTKEEQKTSFPNASHKTDKDKSSKNLILNNNTNKTSIKTNLNANEKLKGKNENKTEIKSEDLNLLNEKDFSTEKSDENPHVPSKSKANINPDQNKNKSKTLNHTSSKSVLSTNASLNASNHQESVSDLTNSFKNLSSESKSNDIDSHDNILHNNENIKEHEADLSLINNEKIQGEEKNKLKHKEHNEHSQKIKHDSIKGTINKKHDSQPHHHKDINKQHFNNKIHNNNNHHESSENKLSKGQVENNEQQSSHYNNMTHSNTHSQNPHSDSHSKSLKKNSLNKQHEEKRENRASSPHDHEDKHHNVSHHHSASSIYAKSQKDLMQFYKDNPQALLQNDNQEEPEHHNSRHSLKELHASQRSIKKGKGSQSPDDHNNKNEDHHRHGSNYFYDKTHKKYDQLLHEIEGITLPEKRISQDHNTIHSQSSFKKNTTHNSLINDDHPIEIKVQIAATGESIAADNEHKLKEIIEEHPEIKDIVDPYIFKNKESDELHQDISSHHTSEKNKKQSLKLSTKEKIKSVKSEKPEIAEKEGLSKLEKGHSKKLLMTNSKNNIPQNNTIDIVNKSNIDNHSQSDIIHIEKTKPKINNCITSNNSTNNISPRSETASLKLDSEESATKQKLLKEITANISSPSEVNPQAQQKSSLQESNNTYNKPVKEKNDRLNKNAEHGKGTSSNNLQQISKNDNSKQPSSNQSTKVNNPKHGVSDSVLNNSVNNNIRNAQIGKNKDANLAAKATALKSKTNNMDNNTSNKEAANQKNKKPKVVSTGEGRGALFTIKKQNKMIQKEEVEIVYNDDVPQNAQNQLYKNKPGAERLKDCLKDAYLILQMGIEDKVVAEKEETVILEDTELTKLPDINRKVLKESNLAHKKFEKAERAAVTMRRQEYALGKAKKKTKITIKNYNDKLKNAKAIRIQRAWRKYKQEKIDSVIKNAFVKIKEFIDRKNSEIMENKIFKLKVKFSTWQRNIKAMEKKEKLTSNLILLVKAKESRIERRKTELKVLFSNLFEKREEEIKTIKHLKQIEQGCFKLALFIYFGIKNKNLRIRESHDINSKLSNVAEHKNEIIHICEKEYELNQKDSMQIQSNNTDNNQNEKSQASSYQKGIFIFIRGFDEQRFENIVCQNDYGCLIYSNGNINKDFSQNQKNICPINTTNYNIKNCKQNQTQTNSNTSLIVIPYLKENNKIIKSIRLIDSSENINTKNFILDAYLKILDFIIREYYRRISFKYLSYISGKKKLLSWRMFKYWKKLTFPKTIY